MSQPFELREDDATIAEMSREHLESVVRIDSQSDENSESIPSTEGQRVLADSVGAFFESHGARVERDHFANIIASIPGRGRGADKPPVAMMVHLDTSKGTANPDHLELLPAWDGGRIPFPQNDKLWVDVETYPATGEYLGHDILHGPGTAPVGLDDKLGLTHLMTLARLLASNPELDHPPLVLIGRPDEEIGRHAAVESLAKMLAERGVAFGFTVDGFLPYEVNNENFNAAQGSVTFPPSPLTGAPMPGRLVPVFIGGVTTHGCTAKEEGYRNATRLATEILTELEGSGLVPARLVPVSFLTSELRECNAEITFLAADAAAEGALAAAVEKFVSPHVRRGASWEIGASLENPASPDGATLEMLRFVRAFLASDPGFVLLSEDSSDFEGYSNPFRAVPEDDGLRLDIRLRDFDEEGLRAREEHVRSQAEAAGLKTEITAQYVNMAPRMKDHTHLVDWPRQAGELIGVEVRQRPIRGGTGVDPFLDHGVPVANLGTGYFALESEKEFTSKQFLSGHARWIAALMSIIARA